MSTLNGLCTTITAQFQEVVERRLRTRQNDDISLLNVFGVAGIEEIHARVTL